MQAHPKIEADDPVQAQAVPKAGSRNKAHRPAHAAARTGPRAGANLGTVVVLALTFGITVFAEAWRTTGGRWYVVESPSMGAAATVNTLLLDRPAGRIHVGEIISFHPPGIGKVFTHRVVEILANGGIRTKGDINSSVDTWTLTRSDVIGRVSVRLWDVGWLIKATPILLIGGTLIWALTHYFGSRDRRVALRLGGAVVLLALAVLIVKPLEGDTVISLNRTDGVGYGTVVSTGILPIEVGAVGGNHIYLADGHVGTVTTIAVNTKHRYGLDVTPHWSRWLIALLVLVLLAPALFASIFGIGGHDEGPMTPEADLPPPTGLIGAIP